jgi:hypothetical protein
VDREILNLSVKSYFETADYDDEDDIEGELYVNENMGNTALIPAFAGGLPVVILPILIGFIAILLKYGYAKVCPAI